MSRHASIIKALHQKGYKATSDGKILNPSGQERSVVKQSNGYYSFTCKDDKGCFSVRVHKFIAFQLFGDEALEKGIQVRHLDGNKLNNCFSNLKLGTQSDNIMDRPLQDRVNHALKATKVTRKLTNNEVKELRKDRLIGLSYQDLAKKYGISKTTVRYIVQRKTYSNVK